MSLLICPYSLLAAKYRNRNDRPCYKDNLTYWVPFDDLVIHLKYGMHFFLLYVFGLCNLVSLPTEMLCTILESGDQAKKIIF